MVFGVRLVESKVKARMINRPKGSAYVLARNGQVELRRTGFSGPLQIFAQGAVSAVMQGEVIIVTFKTGRVAEYRLSATGNSALMVRNIA